MPPVNEQSFDSLDVSTADGVTCVTINHPPINLMDESLIKQLDTLSRRLKKDHETRVVVFRSADPDFFIPHADVQMISDQKQPSSAVNRELNGFQRMTERFRVLPQVTIGQIEGHVGGGGSELLLALDMRFAAIDKAFLSQPEVGLGILPGGGGTQRLATLVGRARTLEIVLGCESFDAIQAERYGYVNRAIPAEQITEFVNQLAERIAGFPSEAIQRAKASIDAAFSHPYSGLIEENNHFEQLLRTEDARERMQRFLQEGGQSRDGERVLTKLLDRL